MNKFYSVMHAQKRGEILVESLKEYDDQALKKGDLLVNEPFRVKVSEGMKFYDIVHFQDPFNFAISERVYMLLKDANLTGWNSYELAIEGRNEKYYGFQVLGRCGVLIRPKESGFVIGLEFDFETWDGSDFFCPNGTLQIICTEKAKELLYSNRVTNIKLDNISTVEWYSA